MEELRRDYTARELAEQADVSSSRVRQLLLADQFPNAMKRGGAWFIPAEEAEAWLKERQGGAER